MRRGLFLAYSWKDIGKRFLNMACFYGGWLVCMREATGPNPLFGPSLVALLLLYHFATTRTAWIDFILVISLATLGTLVDSVYMWAGMISYSGGYQDAPYLAPLWITALWALYASSVNHSLEWLKIHYYFLAAPLGAFGAVSSYLVGIKMGAAVLHYSSQVSLAVIGSVWALVVPLSLAYSEWLKRRVRGPASPEG